jgi:hypothetical protein
LSIYPAPTGVGKAALERGRYACRYHEALVSVGGHDEARRDVAESFHLAMAKGQRSVLARLARPEAALVRARSASCSPSSA